MKQNLLLFCCIFFFFATKAQQPLTTTPRPFITIWSTAAENGATNNNQIFFRATGTNFTVSWVNMNDASDTDSRTASAGDIITFKNQGIYKVYITPGSGTFSAITFDDYEDPDFGDFGDNFKLLSIEQWGDIQWSTFDSAFPECDNMVLNAADVPNLSNVTDLSNMFLYCGSITTNDAMKNWNTSHITNMSSMFYGTRYFNQPINNWDVSNVTNMSSMFDNAFAFNQPINNWDVSNVTNMSRMFFNSAFNQPIGNWNVSKVTAMSDMFNLTSFNQPLSNWNVSNVTDMSGMFSNSSFNQPVSNWNVSNVKTMSHMFGAGFFNEPIGNWNVSNVTDMSYMFGNDYTGASRMDSFNQPIGNWNVSNVTNMIGMFQLSLFNQAINSWNVSKVVSMQKMFYFDSMFNQPLDNWNVSNVASMDFMFADTKFNQPIGNWITSKVSNINGMFNDDFVFNQPLDKWNVSNVLYMQNVFLNAHAFNQNIGSWNLKGSHANGALFIVYMNGMLNNSGMDCSHYSQTLKGWATNSITAKGVSLGAAGLIYDSVFAQAAHDSLTNIKGWTIYGDSARHCSVILPVNFISFNAIQQGNAAQLSWKVAKEINAKGYNVEKSTNSNNYNAIGFVTADGKQTSYAYMDNNLSEGTSYYRIKEIDNDGKFVYSNIRKIEYAKFSCKINGNPISNSSVSLMLDKAANISIQVVSSNGNVIKTIQKGNLVAGNYNIPLNIDNISSGLYLVRLMVDDKAYASTVVK